MSRAIRWGTAAADDDAAVVIVLGLVALLALAVVFVWGYGWGHNGAMRAWCEAEGHYWANGTCYQGPPPSRVPVTLGAP